MRQPRYLAMGWARHVVVRVVRCTIFAELILLSVISCVYSTWWYVGAHTVNQALIRPIVPEALHGPTAIVASFAARLPHPRMSRRRKCLSRDF